MIRIKVKQATNIFEKTKGLLGTKKAFFLLLKTRWGIHTFGMQYPIDVVILNNEKKVVTLKPNLKPNRIFLWNPKYFLVLELTSGFILKNKLNIGEKIVFLS